MTFRPMLMVSEPVGGTGLSRSHLAGNITPAPRHSDGPDFPSHSVFPRSAEIIYEKTSSRVEMAGRERDITTESDDAGDSPDDSSA